MLVARCLIGLRAGWLLSVLLLLAVPLSVSAQADQPIYTDSLQNSWANWSWGSTINFGNTSPVHSGSSSMAIAITNGYAGLYLQHADFDSTPYTNLTFWVHGGSSGGQPLAVRATLGGTVTGSQYNFSPTAGTWQQVTVPPRVALTARGCPPLEPPWTQKVKLV